MTEATIPGENEISIVDVLIARCKPTRVARGEVDGYSVKVSVSCTEDKEGDLVWFYRAMVNSKIDTQKASRRYVTRADAYAAFEHSLEQHDELEEIEP